MGCWSQISLKNERWKGTISCCPLQENINELHVELSHPSESITHATIKAMNIQVTGTFKPCEVCALGKAKQQWESKNAVVWSTILGWRLFFDISSPSTPTFGHKKHWLIVIDDSSDYVWSFFLKENSTLADIIIGSIKNLKKYHLQVQYLCCNNAGGHAFKKAYTQERLWGAFSIQPQVCNNKMAVWKENPLPFSTSMHHAQ